MLLALSRYFSYFTVAFVPGLTFYHVASYAETHRLGEVSSFIPYANNHENEGFYRAPRLDLQVSTTHSSHVANVSPIMDTGSAGYMLSAKVLNLSLKFLSETYTYGFEFLSSSHVYYEGYWIEKEAINITFVAADVVAKIAVLAVTETGRCNLSSDGCKDGTKTNVIIMPTSVNYFGVGFGRCSNEQPNATLDKIPFSNVATINDESVEGRPYYQGYIINSTGVTVGLTDSNVKDFSTVQLKKTTKSSLCKDQWDQVEVAIQINGSKWTTGNGLFDTGLNRSYVRADDGRSAGLLPNGTSINAVIGGFTNAIADYSITVGDFVNPLTPWRVTHENWDSTRPGFINTGSYFYRVFETFLDASEGVFGIRRVDIGGISFQDP